MPWTWQCVGLDSRFRGNDGGAMNALSALAREAGAMDDAQDQLDTFLARFTPEVEDLARRLLARMKALVPGATILVYDNYNALAIGFAPGDKASRAVLSLALYPCWVNLFFLFGVGLPDPHGLLRGEGSRVRHVRCLDEAILDDPRILALIAEAVARAEPPFDPAAGQRLIVKMALPNRRARRPGGN